MGGGRAGRDLSHLQQAFRDPANEVFLFHNSDSIFALQRKEIMVI
jgi:hypothetical protein